MHLKSWISPFGPHIKYGKRIALIQSPDCEHRPRWVFLSVSPLVGQMVSQSVGVKYPSKRSIDRLLGHLIITEESDAKKYISTLTEFFVGRGSGGGRVLAVLKI